MPSLLWWVIVGLIAGWATGKLMRGSGYGVLMDIVLGIVGAIVGGWIMRALGFAGQGGMVYTILVAIGGAVVLTALIRLISGRTKVGSTDKKTTFAAQLDPEPTGAVDRLRPVEIQAASRSLWPAILAGKSPG